MLLFDNRGESMSLIQIDLVAIESVWKTDTDPEVKLYVFLTERMPQVVCGIKNILILIVETLDAIIWQSWKIYVPHSDRFGCHRIGMKDRYGSWSTIVRFSHRKDATSCLWNKKYLNLNRRDLGCYYLTIVENLCPSFRSIWLPSNRYER